MDRAKTLPRLHSPAISVGGLAMYPRKAVPANMVKFKSKFDEGLIDLSTPIDDLTCWIPRAMAMVGPETQDMRSMGFTTDWDCVVKPRNAEQERVIKESYALLLNGEGHILQATTGFGKTYVATHLASLMSTTTLVIVTKDDLMEQWRTNLLKYSNLKPEEIGTIQQDKWDWQGKPVVLAMVHTLVNENRVIPPELEAYFGLVIFDEVHRMAADTFQKACTYFTARLRLGLSATPERVDGKDPIFLAHIGPVLVRSSLVQLPPKAMFVRTGWQVPHARQYVKEGGRWRNFVGPLKVDPGKLAPVVTAMASNAARNDLIVDLVKRAYDKGRTLIVFSDQRKHLTNLQQLAAHAGIPEDQMAFYVGGMSDKQREAAKTKRVLWATYAMTAEATDIPWLDTAVLATPRANVLQAVGRVLREWPEKKQPLIIDMYDDCNEVLVGFARKRRREYEKTLHAEIVL